MKTVEFHISEAGNNLIYTLHKEFVMIDQLFVAPQNRGQHWFMKHAEEIYKKYKKPLCLTCFYELISYYEHFGWIYQGSVGGGLFEMDYDPNSYD